MTYRTYFYNNFIISSFLIMEFFIVTFRETLEAAIIVWLIYSIIRVAGGSVRPKVYLFGGVVWGILFSFALFLLLKILSLSFEWAFEKTYEGILMLLAWLLITHLIFWSYKKAKHIKKEVTEKVQKSIEKNELFIIALIAFMSVAREGIETVLFFSALGFDGSSSSILLASLWVILWLIVSLGVIKIFSFVKLHHFFTFTNILLILIAGWLLGHAISEFEGAGLIPKIMKPLYDMNFILSESQGLWAILKAGLSYDANPSLLAFLVQFGYIGIMIYLVICGKSLFPKKS